MKTKLYLSVILLGLFFSFLQKANAQIPTCQWAQDFGGVTLEDVANDITTDNNGDIYIVGNYLGTVDFNYGPGVYNLTSLTIFENGFILKLDASGNFLWAKSFGTGFTYLKRIKLDNLGNIYLAGMYGDGYATDFDPGPGTFIMNAVNSSDDIFVTKLDQSGNFIWAKSMGGATGEELNGLEVDSMGNVYTTGHTQGGDFDPGPGVFNIVTGPYDQTYVSKLDSSGNFVWAKSLGNTNTDDQGNDITVDNSGNVYTTGKFVGNADFDPGPGTYYLNNPSGGGMFISKLNSSGSFVFAKQIAQSEGYSIDIDGTGNIITTGYTNAIVDFDPGPGTVLSSGYTGFVLKLDSGGNFIWAKEIEAYPFNLKLDDANNIYTSGYISDGSPRDVDPDTSNTYYLTSNGGTDGFFLKLDSSGNFDWAKSFGGTDDEQVNSTAVLSANEVCVVGYFNGTVAMNAPLGPIIISNGQQDMFIAKLGSSCSTSATINSTGCISYTSPSGNYNWTSSGIYMDTIPNALGCDSIITINLTINPLPVALYTLYQSPTPHNWYAVNQCTGTPPLTYAWNWGDGSAVSTGATPSHTYADSGYYNVCVTITDGNGCVNTYCDSSTYIYKGNSNNPVTMNVVMQLPAGINDIDGNSAINISPNPVSDVLNVSLNKPLPANSVITINDMQGRIIKEEKISENNLSAIPIYVGALSPGVYLLKVNEYMNRFVKM